MIETGYEETTSEIRVDGRVVLSNIPTTVVEHEEGGTTITATLTLDQWESMPSGEARIWLKEDDKGSDE